ncbi:dihydrofolate reductase family protein [Alkalicoccus chagannorensis]|uniref:dihydrofolate reductase family protein n=1 Tax=Alkalicoccus chagannorensis TaxID=427072 RepID=UPI00042760A6|nr:dihydrofolate reductase family protein [Alkalicoccus chagannorensis]
MSAEVHVFIAMSLDGYIASKNESLEWLFRQEQGGDTGYVAFYDTIGTVVMGRRTYEWIKQEAPDGFPYADKPCWVFSRTLDSAPEAEVTARSPVDVVTELTQQTERPIWIVGGGQVIRELLEADRIDRFQIAVAPVLLGRGIPLFPEGSYEHDLKLESTRQFDDFVELTYRRKR